MRLTLFIAAALAGSAVVATAALADQSAPAVSPDPPSPSYPESSGGASGYAPQTTHGDYAGEIGGPKPVYAVIAHHAVSGELLPISRALTLVDAGDPQFVCSVSHRAADIRLSCSDGSLAELRTASSGCGQSSKGEPASLCIGYAAKSAARRLISPEGFELVSARNKLLLRRAGA